MKEFKGTKGRWDLQNDCVIWDEVGGLLVQVHQTYFKEQNGFLKKATDEYKYNAKLIASAPEMFEMLKDMLSYLNSGKKAEAEEMLSYQIEKLLTKITE